MALKQRVVSHPPRMAGPHSKNPRVLHSSPPSGLCHKLLIISPSAADISNATGSVGSYGQVAGRLARQPGPATQPLPLSPLGTGRCPVTR